MGRALALAVLAACTAAPPRPAPRPPGSRGLRASEHVSAARDEDRAAEEAATWPDTRQTDNASSYNQLLLGIPWRSPPWRGWDSPAEHERRARSHRGAAAELQASYERACGARGAAEVSASPIARYGTGAVASSDGVIVVLSPLAGTPRRLLEDIECHRAWLMLSPPSTDDPFDLDGLSAEATAAEQSITLHLTVADPALVPELQRRAERDLEQHAR